MRQVKLRQIKPEIRILGVDDGPFKPSDKIVPLVGVVFRGGRWFDGVLKTEIEKDGEDVTEKLIEMIARSRHLGQLRVLMTNGITFGGFNVLNTRRIFKELRLPVIAVSREKPDMRDILKAIRHLPRWRERWRIMKETGRIYPIEAKGGKGRIFIQTVGIKVDDATKIVEMSSVRSFIPEPIRAAHMIATAIVRGESHGRV